MLRVRLGQTGIKGLHEMFAKQLLLANFNHSGLCNEVSMIVKALTHCPILLWQDRSNTSTSTSHLLTITNV